MNMWSSRFLVLLSVVLPQLALAEPDTADTDIELIFTLPTGLVFEEAPAALEASMLREFPEAWASEESRFTYKIQGTLSEPQIFATIEGLGDEVRADGTANNDLLVFIEENQASLNFTPFEYGGIIRLNKTGTARSGEPTSPSSRPPVSSPLLLAVGLPSVIAFLVALAL